MSKNFQPFTVVVKYPKDETHSYQNQYIDVNSIVRFGPTDKPEINFIEQYDKQPIFVSNSLEDLKTIIIGAL